MKIILIGLRASILSHFGFAAAATVGVTGSDRVGIQALGADLDSRGVSVAVVSLGALETDMFTAFGAGYAGRKMRRIRLPKVSRE